MLLILIEAPSLTYHVVGWAWEKLTKERRRPQAILHQAAPVLLRHRSTCPQHVPLYLKPGWRDSAPPEHARWPRTVSEGRRTLPGRSGRLGRMDSSPGSGWPTSGRAQGCRLCSATRSLGKPSMVARPNTTRSTRTRLPSCSVPGCSRTPRCIAPRCGRPEISSGGGCI